MRKSTRYAVSGSTGRTDGALHWKSLPVCLPCTRYYRIDPGRTAATRSNLREVVPRHSAELGRATVEIRIPPELNGSCVGDSERTPPGKALLSRAGCAPGACHGTQLSAQHLSSSVASDFRMDNGMYRSTGVFQDRKKSSGSCVPTNSRASVRRFIISDRCSSGRP
jgi:hypothetical protein